MSVEKIKATAKSGFRWSLIRQIVVQLLKLFFAVVLARLLVPADFGNFTVATMLVGLFNLVNGFGLDKAIIHDRDEEKAAFGAAFVFNISSAFLFGCLIVGLSGYWRVWMGTDLEVQAVLWWLALDLFVLSWCSLPYAHLLRQLNFRRIFWLDTAVAIGSGLLAVCLAYQGWGIWALVARSVSANLLKFIFLSDIIWKALSNGFRWQKLSSFLDYSLPSLGNDLLQYFVRNFDDFLVGKYIGNQALGLYNRSYTLLLLPVRQVGGVFSSVLFPTLSRLSGADGVNSTIYSKVIRTVAFLSFPAMFLCFTLRQPLVLTFLGQKWEDLIPLIGVFSILGAIQSIATLNGSVFLAHGATRLQLKLGVVTKVFVLLCILVGLQYGLLGIAWAYALASVLISIPEFYFTARLLETTMWDLLKGPGKSMLAAIAMSVLAYGVDQQISLVVSAPYLRLIIGVVTGGLFYLSIHRLLLRTELTNFINIAKEQLRTLRSS